MDLVWIMCGSSVDPLWIRDGSSMDPPWIHYGSSVDPLWIRYGSSVDPGWILNVYTVKMEEFSRIFTGFSGKILILVFPDQSRILSLIHI